LSSTEEEAKKKCRFPFGVDDNLVLKKPIVDKPKLSSEINAPVLDVGKSKVKIFPQSKYQKQR
jgi:hypothetical protein